MTSHSGYWCTLAAVLLLATIGRSQEVSVIGKDGIDSLIHHRNGRPLVLNFWATWCGPCKEEFPDLVAFADSFKTTIDVISISVNDPDELETAVRPFLREHKVPVRSFIFDGAYMDSLITMIHPEWTGGIPVTAFYDIHGIRRSILPGKRTFNDFIKSANELRVSR